MISPTWESDCGRVRLYLGDARDVVPLLSGADSVIADPPYGVGLTQKQHKWFTQTGGGYKSTDDTEENVVSVVVPVIRQCIEMFGRVIVTPGTRCAWLYPRPAEIGSIFNRAGSGCGPWGFVCNAPVLYYGKCPFMAKGMGRRPNSFEQSPTDYADKTLDHPCPKPLGLMKWLVLRGSLDGETVLDPFAGTCTTGVACVESGRGFMGIERDPAYFETGKRRIQEALGMEVKGKDGRTQKRMFGAAENGGAL